MARGSHTTKATKKHPVALFYEKAGQFRCPQTRSFTKADVARHRTPDDLWIVIDGNVLDVSSFMPHHPGGRTLLDGAGGQDMASEFAQFHDPSTVQFLESFCIGRLRL